MLTPEKRSGRKDMQETYERKAGANGLEINTCLDGSSHAFRTISSHGPKANKPHPNECSLLLICSLFFH
jgi:hypothetical protein